MLANQPLQLTGDARDGTMGQWLPNFVAISTAAMAILLAIGFSIVTLTSEGYRIVLIASMTFAAIACATLLIPLVRGPLAWRIVAIAFALPVVWLVSDFARRAPFAFGGG